MPPVPSENRIQPIYKINNLKNIAPLLMQGTPCNQYDSVSESLPWYVLGNDPSDPTGLGIYTCALYQRGACCVNAWYGGGPVEQDSNGWSLTGHGCTEEFSDISWQQDCSYGNGLGCNDSNNDGYDDSSYVAGLEEGILLGGQSGDANGDGTLDVLDIVYFIDVILNP